MTLSSLPTPSSPSSLLPSGCPGAGLEDGMTVARLCQLSSTAMVLYQQRSPDVSQMGLALQPAVTSCDQEKGGGLVGLSNKQEEDSHTIQCFCLVL